VIDIKRIREEPDAVKAALQKRIDDVDFGELLAWDDRRKSVQQELEQLRARKNEVSKLIPIMKKEGKDASELFAEMKQNSASTKALEEELGSLKMKIQAFMDGLPNIPDPDVPAGGKEANVPLREWGSKLVTDFKLKDHVELVTSLGLIDYERGVKLGGNGYWLYKGAGARLEWALLNHFVASHLGKGYELVLPPHILTFASGYTAGQFPKFVDDVFRIQSDDDDEVHFLLPTAETALVNLYRDEIVSEEELPRKLCAYTPCYRKEAGSYRKNERGMIRGHQFNKVELFQYTKPEDSPAALEEMLAMAETLVQDLGLHYRVSRLAAKDCSASMAKTLDIEVWIPSMEEYKEVSSASNGRDFQARRGNMRFRRSGQKGTEYLHTLNASGLATSRIIPAIVEQHQQADGSVVVPEVLRPAVGTDVLRPV
jgi:seryl-tRNA synthetase